MALFLFLLSLCPVAGQSPPQHAKFETSSTGLWHELADGFDYSMRALVFGTYQDVADSSQNPDNAFFRIPRHQMEMELRPDARLNWKWLDLSIKPRLNLEWSEWEDGPRDGDSEVDDDWFVNEWLGRARLTEGLFASYGRENLQWGPSYLISPSNPFFSGINS